jgi:hypothetical protein
MNLKRLLPWWPTQLILDAIINHTLAENSRGTKRAAEDAEFEDLAEIVS